MDFLIYKVKGNFQLELIASSESEREYLERERGKIIKLEIRPTPAASDSATSWRCPSGHANNVNNSICWQCNSARA